jgi:hypothetical protein
VPIKAGVSAGEVALTETRRIPCGLGIDGEGAEAEGEDP